MTYSLSDLEHYSLDHVAQALAEAAIRATRYRAGETQPTQLAVRLNLDLDLGTVRPKIDWFNRRSADVVLYAGDLERNHNGRTLVEHLHDAAFNANDEREITIELIEAAHTLLHVILDLAAIENITEESRAHV